MLQKVSTSWQPVNSSRFYRKKQDFQFLWRNLHQTKWTLNFLQEARGSLQWPPLPPELPPSLTSLYMPSAPSWITLGIQQFGSVNNPPKHPTFFQEHTWQELVPLMYNKKGPTAFYGNSTGFCCQIHLAWQVPQLLQGGISVYPITEITGHLWGDVHGQ